MALIHPSSCECLHSGLDLFSIPPTQTAVEEGQFVEIHPLASLAQSAPIEFAISGNSEDYLDLFNTYLHVRAKVTLANGDPISVDSDVAPVNYFLHSLFSQVDISLNDTLITASENTYPYRAYLEATLNYGEDAKNGSLSAALYAMDTPHHFEEFKDDNNDGYRIRRTTAAESHEIDMMGRIHSDIFTQDRYMLKGVDIKIKLTPAKDSFTLLTADQNKGYKAMITHATLVVRKARLNPAISIAHEKALTRMNAKYPFKRVVIKTFAIPKGMLSHNQDNLYMSQTPTRLVLGLVASTAFNGSYTKNPFNFQHFHLTYLNVSVDGRSLSGKPLVMDFDRNQAIRAFFNSNLSLGMVGKDAGNGIDYKHFKNGYTLFAFDLSPSLLDGEQFELAKSGPVSIELKFSQVTTEPIQVIAYAELDSVLEISKTRQVLTDYTA